MSFEISIDEISIDGPSLSRREREELRALLEHDLALRLRRPPLRDDTPAARAPSSSQRVVELGRSIAGGIALSLTGHLPEAAARPPASNPLSQPRADRSVVGR